MQVKAPSPEELAALLEQHPHRHPEKATITVIGDGGRAVRLPVLLGNPSGACRMPSDKPSSPVWGSLLGAGLRVRSEPTDIGEQLAIDCVLCPERCIWTQWVGRWPGLPRKVADLLLQKIRSLPGTVEVPWEGDEIPEPIASALAAHPRAVWRRLRVPGDPVIVIDPPPAPVWRIFQDAIERPHADLWTAVRELAEGRVIASAPTAIGEAIDRWPGIAVLLVGEINRLVGAAAEVELGEW